MQISRGPSAATARQWLQAGPSSLGHVPEPPNFAGPLLNDMSAVRVALVALVQLASDSQLQARLLPLMTMAVGRRHLVVSGPVLVLGWHLPTQPVGIPKPWRIITVSWFSPSNTMQRRKAQYDTVQCSRDTTMPLQPPATDFQDQNQPAAPGFPEQCFHGGQGGRAAVAVLQRRATQSSAASQRAAAQFSDDGLLHGPVHPEWLALVVSQSTFLVDG